MRARVLLPVAVLAACSDATVLADPDGGFPPVPDAGVIVTDAGETLAPLAPPASARAVEHGHFATSLTCSTCHANASGNQAMRDGAGRAIAPFDLWQGTMMANSARDPLWRAVVSAEVAATPAARDAIEAKCTRCHTPMASAEQALSGAGGTSTRLLGEDGALSQLALDGVSCTMCHQISPEKLGTPESFTGHAVIDPNRRIYGPHAQPLARPMEMHTSYTPTHGTHVTTSALCATCHTLVTDALKPDGSPAGGSYHEQAPYLEWRNSTYTTEAGDGRGVDCQGCHAPTRDVDGNDISTRIARNPQGNDFNIAERSPFGRHVFVGGNTLVPAMLRDHPAELRPLASREAFDATIAAARTQLERRTARLELVAPARANGVLSFAVRAQNLAGHKFPSGFPSRRAWLHVIVRDAGGTVVFESGRVDAAGRLVDAAGGLLPGERAGGPLQPHHRAITRAEDVQIYETIMADTDGAPTWTLLRAAGAVKDNKLLPAGWRADHADAGPVRPMGVDGDPDFTAGEDTTDFALPLAVEGPLTIEVRLLYQVLSARFADELFRSDTAEIRALRFYWERADRTPVTVARAAATVN